MTLNEILNNGNTIKSFLSVVLVGGGDAINGDRSNSMKSHALRRANNLGKLRIKEIEQQLATIQLKEPLLHPFAFEYYEKNCNTIKDATACYLIQFDPSVYTCDWNCDVTTVMDVHNVSQK